jgi:hypothetical protein
MIHPNRVSCAFSLLEICIAMGMMAVVSVAMMSIVLKLQQIQQTTQRQQVAFTKLMLFQSLFRFNIVTAERILLTAACTSLSTPQPTGNCLTVFHANGIVFQFDADTVNNRLLFHHASYDTSTNVIDTASWTETPFITATDTTLPEALQGRLAFACNRNLNVATPTVVPSCFTKQNNLFTANKPTVYYQYTANNTTVLERIFLNMPTTTSVYWQPTTLGSFTAISESDTPIGF